MKRTMLGGSRFISIETGLLPLRGSRLRGNDGYSPNHSGYTGAGGRHAGLPLLLPLAAAQPGVVAAARGPTAHSAVVVGAAGQGEDGQEGHGAPQQDVAASVLGRVLGRRQSSRRGVRRVSRGIVARGIVGGWQGRGCSFSRQARLTASGRRGPCSRSIPQVRLPSRRSGRLHR